MSSLMVHSDRSFREEMVRKIQDPKGSFFLPETKPGRIGGTDWLVQRSDRATGIYNVNYTPDGKRMDNLQDPWSALLPSGRVQHFATQQEALNWAIQETA